MDDDGAEIDQNPAAVIIAFGPGDGEAGAANRLDDRIGDGPGLNLGPPGDDDEGVGNDRAAFEIEERELFAFFVFRRGADGCQEIGQSERLSLSDRILRGRRGHPGCFEAILRNTRGVESERFRRRARRGSDLQTPPAEIRDRGAQHGPHRGA